jgi:hypothetical protein
MLWLLTCLYGQTATEAIDLALARKYFNEAKTLSDKDAGRLWGVELYGPMVFVDGQTRTLVANQADAEGRLTQRGDVWTGTLPKEVTIANTALRWAGVYWTMVVWPLSNDPDQRARVMMHELFHRVQDKLGFPSSSPANAHLDSRDGRIWMRLEWTALEKALLATSDAEQGAAATDALTFRALRRSFFPEATKEERLLEMHEGLANYTGVKLAGQSEQQGRKLAVKELRTTLADATFVRSFAYATGPAYGLLLDAKLPDWRRTLRTEDDLGELLRRAIKVELAQPLKDSAIRQAITYDGDRIISEETERDAARQKRLADYRSRFIDNPVLTIPFRGMNIELDPGNLFPFDDGGTVYPTCRITDAWGILTVTDGALIDKNWSKAVVVAPMDANARPLSGPGWTLELKDSWKLAPCNRPGDWTLYEK